MRFYRGDLIMPTNRITLGIKRIGPSDYIMKYLYTSFISLHLLHAIFRREKGNNSGNDPHYLGMHMPLAAVRRIPFH